MRSPFIMAALPWDVEIMAGELRRRFLRSSTNAGSAVLQHATRRFSMATLKTAAKCAKVLLTVGLQTRHSSETHHQTCFSASRWFRARDACLPGVIPAKKVKFNTVWACRELFPRKKVKFNTVWNLTFGRVFLRENPDKQA